MRYLLLLLAAACAVHPKPEASADLASGAREAFAHSWQAYHRLAWGHDELKPLTRVPHDWGASSLLITQVDALDSLILMGFTAEADETRAYIDEHLSFDQDLEVKNFEIVIR
ncbi:MAG TPA: glycoside hydrolase family 47 protein, partial [Myxococcales bacterium]|nr:glycoside hydrolase family 47 protein [Myxococcales bacterium]